MRISGNFCCFRGRILLSPNKVCVSFGKSCCSLVILMFTLKIFPCFQDIPIVLPKFLLLADNYCYSCGKFCFASQGIFNFQLEPRLSNRTLIHWLGSVVVSRESVISSMKLSGIPRKLLGPFQEFLLFHYTNSCCFFLPSICGHVEKPFVNEESIIEEGSWEKGPQMERTFRETNRLVGRLERQAPSAGKFREGWSLNGDLGPGRTEWQPEQRGKTLVLQQYYMGDILLSNVSYRTVPNNATFFWLSPWTGGNLRWFFRSFQPIEDRDWGFQIFFAVGRLKGRVAREGLFALKTHIGYIVIEDLK